MTAVVFVDSSHLLDHPQSSIQYVAAPMEHTFETRQKREC
jgi:hypothetical protein